MKNKQGHDTVIIGTLILSAVLLFLPGMPVHGSGGDGPATEPRISAGSKISFFTDRQQQVRAYVNDEVVVRLQPGMGRSVVEELGASRGAVILEEIPQLNAYLVRVPPRVRIDQAIRAFRRHSGVHYAEPNYVGRGGVVLPNETYIYDQWHLNNIGQTGGTPDADIDAAEGWDITRGKSAIMVAVLDTGILPAHPEFAGRLLPGWDFVNGDSDPTADNLHGLYVSGVLAASADNAYGVAGIDHHAMLLPVKVLDAANLGTTFNLAQGLAFAADAGAHVINMSLVNFPKVGRLLTDGLSYARNAGSVLVACSGNGGIGDADRSYPGASPLVISVGATDHNDVRGLFSGTGRALDVVAPGVDVPTVDESVVHDSMHSFTGCSAATPVVSGIASLLLSLNETLTHDQIYQILTRTADDRVGPENEDTLGRDDFFGFGRVNLAEALRLVTAP